MKNLYLERYAYPESYLNAPPPPDLRTIVVIPSFREEQLIAALESLRACHPTPSPVKIIVVVNQPENCDAQTDRINEESYRQALQWQSRNNTDRFSIDIIRIRNMPSKHAGVGLARKIGMDEAVRQFHKLIQIHPNIHKEGIIVCFDADCTCDDNYLKTIREYYVSNAHVPAAVVYYEHPLAGDLHPDIYRGITRYELFLRYHVNAQRFAGYRFAHQTVGSCMTVRSDSYQKAGGMNKRKAGEDFYFLQKLFLMENFGEINETRVIPSPRLSDRVPFGTGRTMTDWLMRKEPVNAYAIRSYQDLEEFLSAINKFFNASDSTVRNILKAMPQPVAEFAQINDIPEKITAMNEQSLSPDVFEKRFFQWFNGFRILKFIHYARDHFYPDMPVEQAAAELLQLTGKTTAPPSDTAALLQIYRKWDRLGFNAMQAVDDK